MVEQQLSLEIGGEIETGIVSTFGISGRVGAKGQLQRDSRVHVVVTDEDGEIVISKYGKVGAVAIKTHESEKLGHWTERAHYITLDPLV